MLLALLVNLGFAGGGAVVAPSADKGQDAGHGEPWWSGDWIDPAEVYGTPPEAKPKIRRLRRRFRATRAEDPELAADIERLSREAARLERHVADTLALAEREAAIQALLGQYRELFRQQAVVERAIARHEAEVARRIEAHRQMVLADDERFLMMIAETLDA